MAIRKRSVLLIYTGGTIGMIQDVRTGQLKPFDFQHLTEQLPELTKFDVKLSSLAFEHPIDSSDMTPDVWIRLAKIIEENYTEYDGFVILHGSDTMAFTASALSFMLENLSKPVILTGSQLPIGVIRTDGKENLITAIELAAANNKGKAIISEVCVYFEYQLYRGNRTHKFNAEHFQAFSSSNYPVLVEAGVHLKYNFPALMKASTKKLVVHTTVESNIIILKIFPGILQKTVESILSVPGLKGVILESFGAGNTTTQAWFINALAKVTQKGIPVLNITQCNAGSVIMGKYQTSAGLPGAGVISGKDMTTEAAVTKMMFVLGKKLPYKQTVKLLATPCRGEMSE